MNRVLQDIRYGVRQLWRSPAFTLAALATLALGIGVNTSLFTLFQAMLLRPMPGVQQSDGLIWITGARVPDNFPVNMSYPDFLEYRQGLRDLVDISVTSGGQFALSSGDGDPERVHGEVVSGNYFSLLRTPFALGRGFLPDEDVVGQPKGVVVLSHAIWRTRFGADPSIVGQRVVVNGQPLVVVGVTTAGFNGPDLELPRQVYMPVAQYAAARPDLGADLARRGAWWVRPVGRMRPGVTRVEVETAARAIAGLIATAHPESHERISARTFSAKSGLPAGSDREVVPLVILCSIVTGLVLLIACANVSNLLLARAVTRRREIGIRLSLGAGRARVVGQLLTESALLAAGAGILGLFIASWSTHFLISSGVLPLQLDTRPDSGVIAFTLAGTALAVILFGVVPAIEATRSDIATALKDGVQGSDPSRTRLQGSFVITQLALSLVLLTTSGLFLRSMYKASRIDIGFEATPLVLAMSFDLGLQRYSTQQAEMFVRSLDARARSLPEVENVSFTSVAPLGDRYVATELTVDGADSASHPAMRPGVFESSVRPGYFSTLGMRLVRGRDFTDRDDGSSTPVAIISDATARTLWPAGDAIGRRISLRGESGPYVTVVGVASDVLLGGPTEGMRATVYLPQRQQPNEKALTLLVRSRMDVAPLARTLRREIQAMDPDLPVYNVRTLAEYRRLKLSDRINGAAILGGFGGLALLLASIGVYGVMAFTVLQRTKEIGIRVALGASAGEVVGLFIRRGMRLALIGLAIGLALSLAMSQLLQGMLFGLTPTDAVTFVGVGTLLAGIALLASWLPARRAARVEAIQALRYE